MQNPPGVGSPACASAARFAALGPTQDRSVALPRGRTNAVMQTSFGRGAAHSLSPRGGERWISPHVIAVSRQRIDDGDLLDREIRNDLDGILVHDQHFLDAYAVMEFLPVLRLERKRHAFFDFDRMIERPDARDDRRIVLRQTQAMAP